MSEEKLDQILNAVNTHHETAQRIEHQVQENKLIARQALHSTEFTSVRLEEHIEDDRQVQNQIKIDLRDLKKEVALNQKATSSKFKYLIYVLIAFIVTELIALGPDRAMELARSLIEIFL